MGTSFLRCHGEQCEQMKEVSEFTRTQRNRGDHRCRQCVKLSEDRTGTLAATCQCQRVRRARAPVAGRVTGWHCCTRRRRRRRGTR